MSFSLVETGVPREKPLQAKLRAVKAQVNQGPLLSNIYFMAVIKTAVLRGIAFGTCNHLCPRQMFGSTLPRKH